MSQDQIFDVISNYISHIVNQSDNDLLTKISYYMKIKFAVFTLNMNSAPGSNGFRRYFYHTC